MQQRGMRVIFQTLGAPELLIILGIVVLLFGAGKVAGVGGALGKSIREFREERDGIKDKPKSQTKKLSKPENEEE